MDTNISYTLPFQTPNGWIATTTPIPGRVPAMIVPISQHPPTFSPDQWISRTNFASEGQHECSGHRSCDTTKCSRVCSHKEQRTSTQTSSSVTVNINGNPVTIENPDPSMRLVEYLRTNGYTGTKKTCGEGGCGVCTVMLNRFDQATNQQVNIPINSCLRPICSLDGLSITTVEGIGSQKAGFHPIQERIAEFNGTQCGYCTPGMVMNMYSLLENNPNPTETEIENHFDGNLCRCTGYRSILTAMKSFASDTKENNELKNTCGLADIEELCPPKFDKYQHKSKISDRKEIGKISKPLKISVNGVTWLTATQMSDIFSFMNEYNGSDIKLVVGNTSSGVFKEDHPNVLIDVSNVEELYEHSVDSSGVNFGAAITIADVMNFLTQTANSGNYPSYQTDRYLKLVKHMGLVANVQVRSVGSWCGNIMMAHNHNFPSDLYTIFMGAGATLTILTGASNSVQMDLSQFIGYDMTGAVIQSIHIPFGLQNQYFETYKVMLRHENSHAIVNAAYSITIDNSGNIGSPIFAYGGVITTACRMTNAEKAITGMSATSQQTLQSILPMLQNQNVLDPTQGRVAYRQSLITSLFYKFFLSLQPSLESNLTSAVTPFDRPVSSGIQQFQTSPSEFPVSEPIPKLSATLQASGEARYTSDVPSLPQTLFAACVCSTMAKATLQSIDASAALAAPGVVQFFSAKDLSPQQNQVGPIIQDDEELFVTSEISYYGQVLGLIVADTERHAEEAAKLVNVTYTNIQTPILTLDDAISQSSFFPIYPQAPTGSPVSSGNIAVGFQNSDVILSGSVSCGSQYHFHMETQSVYCIPDENETMKIIGATQWTSMVQSMVARILGKTNSSVSVETRRLGGAFGAKITRNLLPFCATAFAADRLGKPVRMQMDLNTNMNSIGKRSPSRCDYKVGFDKDGKLQAGRLNLYVDGGAKLDTSNGVVSAALYAIDNVYYCPNTLYNGTLCLTNTPPNTSARGPGWVQAIFFAESIMEHIADYLQLPVTQVKSMNFYQQGQVTPYQETLKYFGIPSMWNQLVQSSDYQQRLAAVQTYNLSNTWTKRGIAVVPIKFGVYWSGNQFGSLVNVYPDGTVNVSHSGIEMGQGINTKVVQAAAMTFGIPITSFKVADSSTLMVPNAAATGGSVGSEFAVQSTIIACNVILDRLAPLRQSLSNKNGSPVSWNDLISAAASSGVDLQGKGWFNPPASPLGPQQYNSYGISCAEVQIDVLTGETQVLRADILEDTGISMNPLLDVGQIEGAFVQGLGYHLTEEIIYDQTGNSGALITNGTWEYKIPSTKDIPIDLRVTLLKNSTNPLGVLGSKAVGEPPLCMSCVVLFAVKNAVTAARSQISVTGPFEFDSPCTVDRIQQACQVAPSQFFL
eukprot:TRINITY_DN1083_c0_g1_i1.p1 TRINITY_DN1083_c0_g1~~TRINITY_DN1083_c0_g1_i1.p1  ORF type:complete len:1374 (-),score=383.49 TRINITY_DN1083_c0_g1_i1:31-4152(-)